MKTLLLTLALTAGVQSALANEVNPLSKKIDEHIIALEKSMMGSNAKLQVIPWSIMDAKENQFWAATIDAYDFLLQNQIGARYLFLYSAARVSSLPYEVRIEALRKWLLSEDNRILGQGLPDHHYASWKNKIRALNKSIDDLALAPSIPVTPEKKGTALETKALLKELKTAINKKSVTKVQKLKASNEEINYLHVSATALVFLCIGLIYPRKKKVIKRVVRQKVLLPEVPQLQAEIPQVQLYPDLPPLPVEEPTPGVEAQAEIAEEEIIATNTFKPLPPGISIEDECRIVLEENAHLINLANLSVHPMARSPFKTNVHAPQDKIKEALEWLVKGTIAVANISETRPSHMEWKCHENDGRVTVEFILHGTECDTKTLSKNAILDGDGSAPAHFGRTEATLNDYLPAISFRSQNKKTIISFGVDTSMREMTH